MRRVFFLCMAVLSLALLFGCESTPKEPVFRNVYWGMTEDEVKESETVPLLFEDLITTDTKSKANTLQYSDTVFDTYCTFRYYINREGELDNIKIDFTQPREDNNDYLDDYEKLKQTLISLYGKPSSDKENWYMDSKKGKEEFYGQAVENGELSLSCTWRLDEMRIKISLSGHDQQISLRGDFSD